VHPNKLQIQLTLQQLINLCAKRIAHAYLGPDSGSHKSEINLNFDSTLNGLNLDHIVWLSGEEGEQLIRLEEERQSDH
jgi:hypothetical protein